jgi:hypothetical protein
MVFFDVSGETNFMKYDRGGVAALIFFSAQLHSGMEIILLPARETGLLTVKETRTLYLPHDFAADTTVWNIVLLVSTYLILLQLIENNILTRMT